MRFKLTYPMALPALELIDSVDELKAAMSDAGGFIQRLVESFGAAAKRFVIAQLRPLLEMRSHRSAQELQQMTNCCQLGQMMLQTLTTFRTWLVSMSTMRRVPWADGHMQTSVTVRS